MSKFQSTVFVVDDDTSFLTSVERLLRAIGYMVETFTSAAEFLAQRTDQTPGCVVSDLRMPDMDGMALQEALAKTDNPLPIVFLSGEGDIPTSVKAIRSGAEDFLTKTAPKEELLAAIERALARDRRERQSRIRNSDLMERFGRLSPRENQVLGHVLRGQLNKQIAWDLGIDERSVKRHRSNLMNKLDLHSVAELAQCAVEAGITVELLLPDDSF